MQYFPVLLETAGNQSYIFASNRLRENAGASNNVYCAGTRLVIDALTKVFGEQNRYAGLASLKTTKDFIREIDRLADGSADHEIVLATSGKALLLIAEETKAKELISAVTKRALEQYPGLLVLGVIGEQVCPADKSPTEMGELIRKIHKDINRVKQGLPPSEVRFPNMAFLQPCHSSRFPAQCILKEHGEGDKQPYGAGVSAKRGDEGNLRDRPWFDRICRDLDQFKYLGKPLAMSLQDLDNMEELDWSAIIHADGNGFGQVFQNFDQYASENCRINNGRQLLDLYRRFSGTLEMCGLKAFAEALQGVERKDKGSKKEKAEEYYCPVVPVVLGGDDLTVIMDGRQAIKFSERYLEAFERLTTSEELDVYEKQTNYISKVTGGRQLGACAGIAIVKPHHPFHRAYELAEELLVSAKSCVYRLNTAVSALDFHVLYDGGATDLEKLRDRSKIRNDRLTLRPYVVSPSETFKGLVQDKDLNGVDLCRMTDLRKWHKEIGLNESGEEGQEQQSAIPRSQLYMLRSALFEGRELTQHRLSLIVRRYKKLPFDLYLEIQDGAFATPLLDVLELDTIENQAIPIGLGEQND